MRPNERRLSKLQRPQLMKRADGEMPMIVGYAAVFYDSADPDGTEYKMWDDLTERIMPDAFGRAIKEDDVRALFNHEDNLLLGRTTSKTLRLSVDKRGLKYEIDPPNTQAARDLIESLSRGDVDGSSFSFVPNVTSYRTEGKVYIVERHDLRLYDVGPVTFPAYTGTESGTRSTVPEAEAKALREEAQRLLRKNTPLSRDSIKTRARLLELDRRF
jgi:HK97 family phage prohead protease